MELSQQRSMADDRCLMIQQRDRLKPVPGPAVTSRWPTSLVCIHTTKFSLTYCHRRNHVDVMAYIRGPRPFSPSITLKCFSSHLLIDLSVFTPHNVFAIYFPSASAC